MRKNKKKSHFYQAASLFSTGKWISKHRIQYSEQNAGKKTENIV